MSDAQLADYLINHDFEFQILRADYEGILDYLNDEDNDLVLEAGTYSIEDVKQAVAIAQEDPYVQSFAYEANI